MVSYLRKLGYTVTEPSLAALPPVAVGQVWRSHSGRIPTRRIVAVASDSVEYRLGGAPWRTGCLSPITEFQSWARWSHALPVTQDGARL